MSAQVVCSSEFLQLLPTIVNYGALHKETTHYHCEKQLQTLQHDNRVLVASIARTDSTARLAPRRNFQNEFATNHRLATSSSALFWLNLRSMRINHKTYPS